jgi:hypothetical protein
MRAPKFLDVGRRVASTGKFVIAETVGTVAKSFIAFGGAEEALNAAATVHWAHRLGVG